MTETSSNVILFSCIVLLFAVISGLINHQRRSRREVATTYEAAIGALGYLQEWAKWTSAVQAAVLVAFGWFVKADSSFLAEPAAIAFLIFTGTAMLCGAWLLSGIPSIRLRVGGRSGMKEPEPNTVYDIYEYPLYGGARWPPLSYIMNFHHWSWVAALVSLGRFVIGQ